jgi:hypothetical protein
MMLTIMLVASGEIEMKVLTLYYDVTRQPAQA